jgi:sulfite dehydrogenase (quinone) subunit SoeC
MRPAFSVIFLTTLIGAGQGLFLALYSVEVGAALGLISMPDGRTFFAVGSLLCLVLTALGLGASFLHLGHPERAWRAAAMWRTSWLSREVIALPAFMAAVFVYGAGHYVGLSSTLAVGAAATILCLALYVCTGMIYACLKFLQEWASPLTVVNFALLGCVSGFTLAAAFSAYASGGPAKAYADGAIGLTLLGLATRTASLVRNSRIKPRSTVQTAIGVRHPRIRQKSQGFMGGSFNTHEFFHGRSRVFLRGVKWLFLALAFALPLPLLALGSMNTSAALLCAAFAVQFSGLIAERWFFFAEANHPQNLYYQVIS